jgi:hypothetical protein
VFTVIPIKAANVAQVSKPARRPSANDTRVKKPAIRFLLYVLLLCFITFAGFAQSEPPASYFRSCVNDIPNEPLVTVTVTNAVGVSCFTIEEDLPESATALQISGDGVYLPAPNAIRWGPYFNITYTNVSYRLTGLPASYPVNGGAWMDGAWYFSPGVTMIPVLSTSTTVLPTPPVSVATPVSTITPPGIVPVFNGSFESPALGADSYIYFDAMTATQQNDLGWVGSGNFTNGPALFSDGSVLGYSTATNGVQAISLQGNGAIAQTINFPAAGTFTLNWWAASLRGETNPAVVQVDGTTLLNWQATNTAWQPFSTPVTLSSGGLHSISFAGTGGANVSVGLDDVSITGTNVPASVTIFCPTPGASIYYTVNDGPPTTNSILYTGAIYLTSLSVIWAEAFETNLLPSASAVTVYGPPPASANVQVTRSISNNGSTAPTVTFTVAPGTNANCVTVMETLPAGLSAINVSDGGNYITSNNVVLWGPFLGANLATNQQTLSYQAVGLPGTYPVQASWSVDGVGGGETAATSIVIAPGATNVIPTPLPQVATPVFTPGSGGNVPVSVTITDATPGAVIYYTLNGPLPTQSSVLYTGPIPLSSAGVLWAAAFTNGWTPSASSVAYYGPLAATANAQVTRSVVNNASTAPVVTFTVVPGTNANCVAVMETLPAGLSAINVSDGGNYITSNNVVRWGPFVGANLATNQQTLSYQAVGLPGTYPVQASWSVDGFGGGETSPTSVVIVPATTNLIPTPPLQEPTPVMTPSLASNLPVTVAISDSDPQAQIYYTTDGTLPTQNSTAYTRPLTFDLKTALRAVAYRSGCLPSAAALGEYDPPLTTNIVSMASSIVGNGSFLPTISLTATPQGSNYCYAMVEPIPYGITASGLSGDGIWDPILNEIRWGPYMDNQPRVFSFNVGGASGIYTLSGQASFNGYSTNITTLVQVNAQYIGSPPITNLAACVQDNLVYNRVIDPAPDVTVTSVSGTVNWGDGSAPTPIDSPYINLEHTYTVAGTYSIVVTADWSGYSGSTPESGVATVTDPIQIVTTCEAPQIVTQPSNQVVLAGSTAQFSVSASSSVPMTYQWYFNTDAGYFSADDFATLTLPNVTLQFQGLYSVIITNAFGSVTSSVVSLKVVTPFANNVVRNANGTVTLSFTGLPNVTTRVWATTNLVEPNWLPIYTNTITTTNGMWQFTDTNRMCQERYYRFSTP